MSEEKLKVLDMLNSGKITFDEAMTLLDKVIEEERPPAQEQQDWEHQEPRRPNSREFSWIDDIRSAIEETTSAIGETITGAIGDDTHFRVVFPGEFFYGAKRERFTASSQKTGDTVRSLVFEAKNAPLTLEPYGGDRIEVEAYYKARSQWDPRFSLNEDGGVCSLSYDSNALYMLGINIRVPKTAKLETVRLKNKNGTIKVDNITADKVELNTKNETIRVSGVKGDRLFCETKNASVVLDDADVNEIDAQTSNSKISLEDISAFRVRLVTTNAKIDVRDSSFAQLSAKTTNSPIKFDGLSRREQDQVCSIDGVTSNGQISVCLPQGDTSCRLRASTTLSGISNALSDLVYLVNEGNYVEAQTVGYETAQNKLNLNLQTTNSKIYIR